MKFVNDFENSVLWIDDKNAKVQILSNAIHIYNIILGETLKSLQGLASKQVVLQHKAERTKGRIKPVKSSKSRKIIDYENEKAECMENMETRFHKINLYTKNAMLGRMARKVDFTQNILQIIVKIA